MVDIILTVLLVLAIVILLIIVALYVVPFTFTLIAERAACTNLVVALAYWGIFGAKVYLLSDGPRAVDIRLARYTITRKRLEETPEEKEEKERKKREKPERELGVKDYLNAFTELWPHLREMLKAFLRSFTIAKISGNVVLGLPDPTATGTLYGYVTAFRYAIWPVSTVDFSMIPVFNRVVFEGRMLVEVRIERPLTIMIPAVVALTKKPVRDQLRLLAGR
ncbi:MAG: DUF2953 domain-containing protein [Methanomicrobiaceae archaeon]|nr:DUF2953 domain-containing protein [Methanomicrobiaceae archaeon]